MTPETEQSLRRGLVISAGLVAAFVGIYLLVALALIVDALILKTNAVMKLPPPVLDPQPGIAGGGLWRNARHHHPAARTCPQRPGSLERPMSNLWKISVPPR